MQLFSDCYLVIRVPKLHLVQLQVTCSHANNSPAICNQYVLLVWDTKSVNQSIHPVLFSESCVSLLLSNPFQRMPKSMKFLPLLPYTQADSHIVHTHTHERAITFWSILDFFFCPRLQLFAFHNQFSRLSINFSLDCSFSQPEIQKIVTNAQFNSPWDVLKLLHLSTVKNQKIHNLQWNKKEANPHVWEAKAIIFLAFVLDSLLIYQKWCLLLIIVSSHCLGPTPKLHKSPSKTTRTKQYHWNQHQTWPLLACCNTDNKLLFPTPSFCRGFTYTATGSSLTAM